MKIMISYNWKSSEDLAENINKNLKKNGFETWIDKEQMHGNIVDQMAEAVENSDLVLILVTKQYCESENCKNECNYASNKKKIIIPIKVNDWYDPSGRVGFILAQLNYVDFSRNTFDQSFQNLLTQINLVMNVKSKNKTSDSNTLPVFYSILKRNDYRFSFKINDNDYFYYEGQNKWRHCKNDQNLESYNEISRDAKCIKISLENNSENVIELEVSNKSNSEFPFWCPVWRKIEYDIFIYPMSDNLWVEISDRNDQNIEKIISHFKLIKMEENIPYFKKKGTDMYLKLIDALYWGYSVDQLIYTEASGKWMNNVDYGYSQGCQKSKFQVINPNFWVPVLKKIRGKFDQFIDTEVSKWMNKNQ